ncbi:hypothetical protein DUI87_27031 [Hirundo rustica rustica]|uniref:Integrase-type domain-containing protein n=1 Tax=Hirundo rustica rustica TaxID=333673 RepID=A0A3M0J6J9_HIRRU|nr:hypothetical protein DUI87_27031 [Hirundo rustica rustica]
MPTKQLRPATSGSLGMDVAAAVDVTIMTTNPLKIPTGLIGPIIINGQPVFVARIEDAFIKEVRNQRLYQLLMQLNKALHQREQPYAVIHIRSHKWNIGLGEGNQRADELVSTAITVPLPQHVLAREAHSIFHQNAKGLQKEFHISHAEATAIVRSCPICCHHNGGLGLGTGVNPRGVMANETVANRCHAC